MVTVYTKTARYQLEPIPSILSRCNQALQTLERYKPRLNEESTSLTALEVEDQVMLRDVVSLLQRAELVARISEEIEQYLVELGTDGRLVRLQLRELMAGVEDERRLVVLDYLQPDAAWDLEQAIETLSEIGHRRPARSGGGGATALHLAGQTDDLDSSIQPAGTPDARPNPTAARCHRREAASITAAPWRSSRAARWRSSPRSPV